MFRELGVYPGRLPPAMRVRKAQQHHIRPMHIEGYQALAAAHLTGTVDFDLSDLMASFSIVFGPRRFVFIITR